MERDGYLRMMSRWSLPFFFSLSSTYARGRELQQPFCVHKVTRRRVATGEKDQGSLLTPRTHHTVLDG